jgi:hypothetical protein
MILAVQAQVRHDYFSHKSTIPAWVVDALAQRVGVQIVKIGILMIKIVFRV